MSDPGPWRRFRIEGTTHEMIFADGEDGAQWWGRCGIVFFRHEIPSITDPVDCMACIAASIEVSP